MKAYVPIRIMMIEKRQTTPKSKKMLNFDIFSITPRIPSTAYVTGLKKMNGESHDGKFVIGKSAPERKNIGKIRKLMIN